MTPFDGTQPVQRWLVNFVETGDGASEQSLVDRAFDYGLADNVVAILRSVEGRLGEKWEWTWPALQVALLCIEGGVPCSYCTFYSLTLSPS
jgi:hypothetical protein